MFRSLKIKVKLMGCSNPHPHGQVWASDQIPSIPQLELQNLATFKDKYGFCLLCEYSRLEASSSRASRVVDETKEFISVVPFWATWPFEILVLSKEHQSDIGSMSNNTLMDLAAILKRVTTRYDNLFECDFPYSMGIHQSPLTNGFEKHRDLSHFHIHFYPPLLRSANVKKWMVGFEMLGEAQRDLTPEQAAERLRSLSATEHYTERNIETKNPLSSKL
ncbi:galactose-1-phosphate uridyl transferase [Entomophthora muscae]|uniref:Galactose-1-phosphate uridyl transferase n=1 Tax=Entomophthora muscae TaxID=34485 RepID=A0ACC2T0W4_9FUNG|nr:galactose-1-phosphate uridyl transferase [Entomophthora muscae]